MRAPRRPRRASDEYRLYIYEMHVFEGTRQRLQPLITHIEDLIELCENESKADYHDQLSPRQLPFPHITSRPTFSLDDVPPMPLLDEAHYTLTPDGLRETSD
jgi:hypothetical protein